MTNLFKKKNRASPPPADGATAGQGTDRGKGGRKKRILLIAAIFGCFFILLFCGIAAAGTAVSRSGVNLPNVYVGSVFVGGMTESETKAALEREGWDQLVKRELSVKLPADIHFTLNASRAGAVLTKDKAVEAACSYGHSGKVFDDLLKYLKNYLSPVDVTDQATTLDEDYIHANIDRGLELLDRATDIPGYKVDEKNKRLEMVKGGGEMKLDEEKLHSEIVKALENGSTELRFDTLAAELKMPDFDKIHTELAVEPADAQYDEYFSVIPEVLGCRFDVSEAKKLWEAAEAGRKVFIPLDITSPEVTGDMLRAQLFRDRLGSQTTYYTWSTDNRINNIKLAAGKLNGYIMLPGEVFSYNETIGQRTEEAGFKTASAYSDGQVVEALGGGICQVSSTLYCASMFAQMKTMSRTNHYFKVDYLDYGLDATVSWTSPDFKFRNDREYPVKITAWCDDESQALNIEIWGTDTDGSYVTLRHSQECVYDEEYTDVLIGYSVTTYRDLYDADGNYLDTRAEPGGVYYFHDENIEWPEEHESITTYLELLDQYQADLNQTAQVQLEPMQIDEYA